MTRLAILVASGFVVLGLGAAAVAQPADPQIAACLDHAGPACQALADRLVKAHDFDRARRISVVACNAKQRGACAHMVRVGLAACDANDAAGCYAASLSYQYGVGAPRDQARASKLQARALSIRRKECDGGGAASCAAVGSSYADGEGVAADPAKAATYYQRGCDGGDATGCYLLGELVKDRDHARAIALFARSCKARYGIGCDALAAATTDPAVRIRALLAACDLGVGSACDTYDKDVDLGRIHMSPAAATHALEARCDKGDGTACDRAALRHNGGDGRPADLRTALIWWARACERGVPRRCSHVAMYLMGPHAPPAALGRAAGLLEIGCKAKEQGDCDLLARVRERMKAGGPAAPRPRRP
jgi:uncharacterized protein